MSYDGTIRLDTGLDNTGIESDLGKLGSVVTAGAAAALTALVGLGAAAIKMGSDFEAAMSKVEAISGASGREMEALRDVAKEMGESTKFSATESAEALTYMAMAGWKTEQMISGLQGIMNLAAASGEQLGLVSDIVTDALTAFGLAAEDSGHFADVLAAASNNANTNVSMLGESFKYVGPVAGALGYSVEDVSVALGLMANSGIKASQAGTSLRTLLTNMVKPTASMAAAMEDLGIELSNVDGTMKPLDQVMRELRGSFQNLTEEEKAMYAATLAGKEGLSGLLAIVNTADEDFDKLSAAIANAEGTAQKMADTMNDNLQGQLVLLGSALEGVGIKVYEKFQEPMKQAVQSAIESVNRLSNELSTPKMEAALDKLADGFANLTQSLADMAIDAIPILVEGLAFVAGNFETLAEVTLVVVSAMAAMKVINEITQWSTKMNASLVILTNTQNATAVATLATNGALSLSQIAYAALTGQISLAAAAQAAWNLVLTANPIGLVVTAAAALAAGVIILRNRMKDATSVTDDYNHELNKLKTRMDTLADTTKNSAEAHKDNIDAIHSETIAAENLAEKVVALSEKEDKSAADKLRLKQYVDLLNESVADLNLLYDEQNDMLSTAADEIQKVISAQKERLLQQAREERALALAKEQAEAEYLLAQAQMAREDAVEGLREAQERLNECIENGKYNNQEHLNAYKEAEKDVRNWTEALNDSEESVEASREQVEASTETFNLYADSMVQAGIEAEAVAEQTDVSFSAAADAIQDFSTVSSENILSFLEHLGFVDDGLKKQMEVLASYQDMSSNAWDKIGESAEVSLEQIIENLTHNIEAMESWSENMQILTDRGVNQGFLRQLWEAGPEAALTVAELVKRTDPELAKLEPLFAGSAQAAVNATVRELGNGEVTKAAKDVIEETRTAMEQSVETADFGSIGSQMVEPPANSILQNTKLIEALQNRVEDASTGASTAVENADFPKTGERAVQLAAEGAELSDALKQALQDRVTDGKQEMDGEVAARQFDETGGQIVDDAARGARDNPDLENAVREQVDQAYTVADNEVRVMNFQTVGYSIAQGIADGIRNGTSAVTSAIRQVISAALAEARTAADAHSPARAFIPLGEDIDAGVAVGMARGAFTSEAAAQMVQTAQAAVAQTHGQMGAMYSTAVTHNSTTTSTRGGDTVFEKGAIVLEATINNDLDVREVGRRFGEEADRQLRWRSGFAGR